MNNIEQTIINKIDNEQFETIKDINSDGENIFMFYCSNVFSFSLKKNELSEEEITYILNHIDLTQVGKFGNSLIYALENYNFFALTGEQWNILFDKCDLMQTNENGYTPLIILINNDINLLIGQHNFDKAVSTIIHTNLSQIENSIDSLVLDKLFFLQQKSHKELLDDSLKQSIQYKKLKV